MADSIAVTSTQESVALAVTSTQSVSLAVTKTDDISVAVTSTQAAPTVAVASAQAAPAVAVTSTQSATVAVSPTPDNSVAVTSTGEEVQITPESLYSRFITNSPFDANRFTDYDNGIYNAACWANGLDLSGASLECYYDGSANDNTRRCALIGRNCAITADHWGPRVIASGTVTFTDPAGDQFTYTLAAESSEIGSDIRVFTLTSNVSPTLTSYSIANDIEAEDYLVASRSRREADTGLFTAPEAQRAMIERVFSVGAASYIWSTASLPAEILGEHTQAGDLDSGDGLFRMDPVTGDLDLVSHYSSVSSGSRLGLASNLSSIDAWLASNGGARLAQKSSLL